MGAALWIVLPRRPGAWSPSSRAFEGYVVEQLVEADLGPEFRGQARELVLAAPAAVIAPDSDDHPGMLLSQYCDALALALLMTGEVPDFPGCRGFTLFATTTLGEYVSSTAHWLKSEYDVEAARVAVIEDVELVVQEIEKQGTFRATFFGVKDGRVVH